MGGRGGSSGLSGKSYKNPLQNSIDAKNLSQKQIDSINFRRYDVWSGARDYIKNTKLATEPTLTKTQQMAFDKAFYDNDFSSLEKSSAKTKQAVYKMAQYRYDRAQKRIANGDYDVKNDYMTRKSDGKRVQSRDATFAQDYNDRKKSARLMNELSDIIKPEREISSSTYKRAVGRTTRDVESFLGIRRKRRK